MKLSFALEFLWSFQSAKICRLCTSSHLKALGVIGDGEHPHSLCDSFPTTSAEINCSSFFFWRKSVYWISISTAIVTKRLYRNVGLESNKLSSYQTFAKNFERNRDSLFQKVKPASLGYRVASSFKCYTRSKVTISALKWVSNLCCNFFPLRATLLLVQFSNQ